MSRPRIILRPAALLAGAGKLLVFCAVIVAAVPSLRTRAAPHVAPALDPVRRLTAKDKVNRVSRYLEHEIHITGLAPHDRDLHGVLRKLFPGRDDTRVDPWGRPYFLRRRGDGFHVASSGPDGRRGTRDDILSHRRALPSAAPALAH